MSQSLGETTFFLFIDDIGHSFKKGWEDALN